MSSFFAMLIVLFSVLSVALAAMQLELVQRNLSSQANDLRLLIAIAPLALAAIIAIKNRFYRSARWMQFHVIAQRMLHEIMFFLGLAEEDFLCVDVRGAEGGAGLKAFPRICSVCSGSEGFSSYSLLSEMFFSWSGRFSG